MASSLTTWPEFPGAGDIRGGDAGDALPVHVGRGDPGVEGQPGQDGRLGRGVEALDVRGGVGLGVAQRLGFLQRVREPGARGVHPVQDVVGGAVDDAQDPVHLVAGQRLAQRPQQRDSPGHRGLVVEVDPVLPGRLVQGGAILGEQCLVGRDHGLAGLHRGEQERADRLDAADHLDHDVHVRPGDQLHGVPGEQRGIDRHGPGPARAPHRDPGHLQPGADPGGQVVGLLREQAVHL